MSRLYSAEEMLKSLGGAPFMAAGGIFTVFQHDRG